jgi:hypothetical protein
MDVRRPILQAMDFIIQFHFYNSNLRSIKQLYSLLLALALFSGCKKTSSTGTTTGGSGDGPPDVTAVGTPAGNPVSKTIGAAGGTITSTDGRVDLIIPAGALSGDVAISIQPITNECPGGIGLAYDLLPNGTKFLTPATLTLHYTDDDVNGTDPLLVNLAFQDSLDQWEVNVAKDVDTVAKTISFDLNHFTPHAFTGAIKIESVDNKYDFKDMESTQLHVVQYATNRQLGGDDELPPLPVPKTLSDNQVSNWRLSGGSSNGNIVGKGHLVTYTAPSNITYNRTIIVTATIGAANTLSKTRIGGYIDVGKDKSVRLRLHPSKVSFMVTLGVNFFNTSKVYFDHYQDGASFEVDIDGDGLASIPTSSIVNQAPTVYPTKGWNSAGDTATWTPDGTGVTDIVSGYVAAADTTEGRKFVGLFLINSPLTIMPSWLLTDIYGHSTPQKGLTAAFPDAFFFFYDAATATMTQFIDPYIGSDQQGLETGTITKLP